MNKQELYRLANKQAKSGIFYKYVTVERAKQILQEKTVFFAKQSGFNDPFELACKIRTGYSFDDWKNWFVQLGDTERQANIRATQIVVNRTYTSVDDIIRKILSRIGIFCMTPFNDNLLMWAHYADSHKGVCIEFDTNEERKLRPYKKVVYNDNILTLDLLERPRSIVDIILHKSTCWDYEQEFRVIDKTSHVQPINPLSIKSVICGCKISAQDESALNAIIVADPNLHHVRVQHARMNDNTYALDIN